MFDAARLKIGRARQHIAELNNDLANFLKNDPGGARILKDFAGRCTLVVDAKPLPANIPLVLGDTIHNLRASLDLMAYEIVTASKGTPTRDCYFPIRDTREALVKAIKSGDLQIVGADICDVITDVVKPYPGGNDSIWSLNRLDIIDKHRLLIPTVGAVMVTGVGGYGDNGLEFSNETYVVGSGGMLRGLATNGQLHITNPGRTLFGVFFPKDCAFEGQPVVPTLNDLSNTVSDAIDKVEKAFVSRS